jgi:hypothetical protein
LNNFVDAGDRPYADLSTQNLHRLLRRRMADRPTTEADWQNQIDDLLALAAEVRPRLPKDRWNP